MRPRPRSPSSSDAIGRRGERAAARALRRRGYRVLARRWRTPAGEVDLLCLDGSGLVVVEVKARAGAGPLPAWRIDAGERRRLRAVRRFVAAQRAARGRSVRIDVVLVRLGPRAAVSVTRDVLRPR